MSPSGSLHLFWFIMAGFHVTCAVTIAKWLPLKTTKELLAERRRGAATR